MKRFAELLLNLILTSSRNDKIDHIVNWIKDSNSEEIGWGLSIICEELEISKVKPSMVKEISKLHIDKYLFDLSYDYVGDMAETVSLIWPEKNIKNANFSSVTLTYVIKDLINVQKKEAPELISNYLDNFDQNTRWAFLKIITGGLRVGVSSRLAKTAISKYFNKNIKDIEELWHAFDPPYKEIIEWCREIIEKPKVKDKPIFRSPMLANPLEENDYKLINPISYLAEWKWDGIRVQLVSMKNEVKLYSRSGDDISNSFPDIIENSFSQDFCLDGELMAGSIKIPGSFNDLQQRLNRKNPSKDLIRSMPTFIVAYDALYIKDQDIRDKSVIDRRELLKAFILEEKLSFIKFSDEVVFKNFKDLEGKRLQCRQDLNYEGLMLKLRNSTYEPGRPKGPWFKFKRDPYSIDVVLLYAQRGHGKRSSFYSDYTFGVWNGYLKNRELVTVGKAYSGFTDQELLKLDKFIRANTTNRFGPVREVEKTLVLEVAFDDIQKSKRHKSGLAMRFPRIKRIRWDKPANEADTIENLERLLNVRN